MSDSLSMTSHPVASQMPPHASATPAYQRNGAPCGTQEFYAVACDPRRSVAVEACAGAGKTWMLVSRMVRALMDGAAPHEILAITFTRRAAGEMKARLYEWLGAFARADTATLLDELRLRGVQVPEAAEQARALADQLAGVYESMLATGRPVQIRTFHGWFAALLRTAPVSVLQTLGLPLNYELLEDDSQARALVWRRFYGALLEDAALKEDFEAVVLTHGRHQAGKALQAALDKRVEFALADAAGVVDRSVEDFGTAFPAFNALDKPEEALWGGPLRQLLEDAARALGAANAPTFSAKGSELERALAERDVGGVEAALMTANGTPRKFGATIAGLALVREAQDALVQVLQAGHQHACWLHHKRLTRLARVLIGSFTEVKRERGWIDMNDVERAAMHMLADPVVSGWVQEKLDARVSHLLIDEFQDTNPLQWQALLAWLGSYAGAGQAPSVFLVGDPKQSIYRFRRAEPQVFRAAQLFVRTALGGDLLACDHTRRNSAAVMEVVNTAMTQASQGGRYPDYRVHTTDSRITGSVGRLPQIMRAGDGAEGAAGYAAESGDPAIWRDSLTTPREIPEETLRTTEARQLARWVSAGIAEGRFGPGEMMVLARKRAGLALLQDELRAVGVPVHIGEKTALIDCCEVLDVVALLDVLVSPQHDLSLARALRSPLFSVNDHGLVQLALAKRRLGLPWLELLWLAASKPEDVAELQAEAAAGLNGIAATLLRWKGWLDGLPPHDALHAIYADGDVLARFAAAAPASQRTSVLANLRALLSVTLALDGGRFITPYTLVRALKAGLIQAPATVSVNAVRLLTVHGAKGLEARVVVLLDTDAAERNPDTMAVLVDWPGESALPTKFVFLASENRPPACCAEALAAEQEARSREELNALYVALTRARETLVVSSVESHRANPDSWWQRLLPLTQALSPLAVAQDHSSTPVHGAHFTLPELPRLPDAMTAPPPARPAKQEDTPASRLGKAMHRLLEWGGTSPVRELAVQREFGLDAQQARLASAAAERILAGEGAWAWNPAVVSWQANEIELVHEGQTLRLDRLVRRQDAGHDGEWWVLDFKSRPEPHRHPELVEQMLRYQTALAAIYPGAPVHAAFLTAAGQLLQID